MSPMQPRDPSKTNANIHFGLALANANVNGDDNVARVVRPVAPLNLPPLGSDKGTPRHFCGASLREKAIRLSNASCHALGMPLVEVSAALPMHGEVHILPPPFPQNDVMPHNQAIQALIPGELRDPAFLGLIEIYNKAVVSVFLTFWVPSVLAYRTLRSECDQEPFEPEYEQIPET